MTVGEGWFPHVIFLLIGVSMSSVQFISYEVNSDFIVFSNKADQSDWCAYPTKVFEHELKTNLDRISEVAEKSCLVGHPDVFVWLEHVHNVISESLSNLKNDKAYKGEQMVSLAPLKNLEFCTYQAVYDDVENARSSKQLVDSLNMALQLIHLIALHLHTRP